MNDKWTTQDSLCVDALKDTSQWHIASAFLDLYFRNKIHLGHMSQDGILMEETWAKF